ncbi:unnamed protein product [Peronospora destructor]|uniref:subtilisin n=1 Tax=Peronospora destructor TaxID=86335 RepID=A0AAV0TJ63_9STRA|nr:unnamed protein product [Peronospora destructor]
MLVHLRHLQKSSYALSRDSSKSKEGPALEIKLAKVVRTTQALTRLSRRVSRGDGDSEFDCDEELDSRDRRCYHKVTESLKTPALEQRLLRQSFSEEADVDEKEMEYTSRRLETEQVDEYVYNNPEILHYCSSWQQPRSAASFAATPCQAVLDENMVASFSSIGPTLDGRQKPDLVAPGNIAGHASECWYGRVNSYEWLRDGWWKDGVPDPTFGMDTIPASLIKPLLLLGGEGQCLDV